MLAILLALASAAGYGGSDYAGGLAARRGNVIRITILAQAVAAAWARQPERRACLRATPPGPRR
jgi:hypothetical protein